MEKESDNEYTDEGCHRTTKEPDRQNQLPVNLDFVWKDIIKILKHTFFNLIDQLLVNLDCGGKEIKNIKTNLL